MRRHTAAHFLSQEEWGYRWRVGEPAHTAREGHLDQLDHWQTTWLSCLSMVNVRRPELKYHPASLLQFCKTFRGKDALMVWRFRTFGFLCFSACCCNRWAIGTGAWRRDDDPSGHAGSWRGALGRGGIRGSGYFIHVRLLIVAIVANSPLLGDAYRGNPTIPVDRWDLRYFPQLQDSYISRRAGVWWCGANAGEAGTQRRLYLSLGEMPGFLNAFRSSVAKKGQLWSALDPKDPQLDCQWNAENAWIWCPTSFCVIDFHCHSQAQLKPSWRPLKVELGVDAAFWRYIREHISRDRFLAS